MEESNRPLMKEEIKGKVLDHLHELAKKKKPTAEDFLAENIGDSLNLDQEFDIEEILTELIDEDELIEQETIEFDLYFLKGKKKAIYNKLNLEVIEHKFLGTYSAIIVTLLAMIFYFDSYYSFTINDISTVQIPPGADINLILEVYKTGYVQGIALALIFGLILSEFVKAAYKKAFVFGEKTVSDFGETNVRIIELSLKIFLSVIIFAAVILVFLSEIIKLNVNYWEIIEQNIVAIIGLFISIIIVAALFEGNRNK